VRFEVLNNPVTGEYGVLRRPAVGSQSATVADLYARPGASVAFEHIHPGMTETFTVVRGQLTLKKNGIESEAGPGTRVSIPPGTPHAWWNAGDEKAWIVVEIDPGARFEAMIKTMFFLAAEGKTDARGRPRLLQGALVAKEFDDVHRLTRPARPLQQLAFAALAPIARLRGLRGSYANDPRRVGEVVEELEALPPDILALLPNGVPGGTAAGPPEAVK
jgi:quercetin dioxygenase-like cupin family protein